LAACAAPAAEAIPTATATLLESFEVLVAANSHFTFSPAPGSKPFYVKACAAIQLIDVSYDVETTNSLVSPYLGTVVYTVQDRPGAAGQYTSIITDIYALQSEGWVLKETHGASSLVGSGHCILSKSALP